jgi:hypothetical protein
VEVPGRARVVLILAARAVPILAARGGHCRASTDPAAPDPTSTDPAAAPDPTSTDPAAAPDPTSTDPAAAPDPTFMDLVGQQGFAGISAVRAI